MKRKHRQRPHHESPHEARLRAIVDELVPDKERRPEYLLFARELAAAERSSYNVHRSSFGVPDYSRRTKRVVLKFFRRGLHGRAMWRIGEAIMRTGLG